jgi:hypothetical protein
MESLLLLFPAPATTGTAAGVGGGGTLFVP